MKLFQVGLFLCLIGIFANFNIKSMEGQKFYAPLAEYVKTLEQEFDQISAERQEQLKTLGDYILEQQKADKLAKLIVICTHNSRRSHMGQIWLATAAAYYDIDKVKTYSGGTEATAFNPRAIASLNRAGFKIEESGEFKAETNPVYKGSYGEKAEDFVMFSKKYQDDANPQKAFCALLVCSQADEACPIVFGASARIAIPYEDPKAFDETPQEAEKYDERCRQIAREMFFTLHYVQHQMR